ncbi:HIT-like protein [Aspergillus sclerotiicarbonarius CBS 121057]|uniref:HIT-like protein n=1 Tax=Aspergillus sclerotiicarbonarius (strain CBS 121057 / IBT 28362) TaxID=1448318 RepID=A0A319E6P5_ASPSB|nr:HIT-like protein [Aspergillus sclerotiicarbonarius CBS 121057]
MTDLATTTIYHDDHLSIALSTSPTTPGHTLAHLTNPPNTTLFSLPKPTFTQTLSKLRTLSTTLNKYHHVHRTALITTGGTTLSLLPLHGLTTTWTPIINPSTTFHQTPQRHITSKDAPRMPDALLTSTRNTILSVSNLPTTYNYTFHGPATDTNLFARIIRGELPQWRIWEDEDHVAFLTPFPNTPGFTVLVPRAHLSSDIFALEEGAFERLMGAAYTVGRVLMKAFGLETCGMVFEGFEIDYAHVKLIPVCGDGDGDDEGGEREVFNETYPGYVSSLPGPEVGDSGELVRMAREIRRLIEEE